VLNAICNRVAVIEHGAVAEVLQLAAPQEREAIAAAAPREHREPRSPHHSPATTTRSGASPQPPKTALGRELIALNAASAALQEAAHA